LATRLAPAVSLTMMTYKENRGEWRCGELQPMVIYSEAKDDGARILPAEVERDRVATAAWRTQTRAVRSGGAALDRAVETGRPVSALWRGRVRGSAAAARGTRWRWSSDTWAPARKAETDRWDPAAELFLN
jgi:hypothetical protein